MGKNTFKANLFDNAIDSLEEGLLKYGEGRGGNNKALKFAVLHLCRFAELSFKYYLTKIHRLLIYKKLFDKNRGDITITMDEAINFLTHERELELDYKNNKKDKFIIDINYIKGLRNKIEHFEYAEPDDRKVKTTLGRILSLIDNLYEKHDSPSEKLIPNCRDLYSNLIDEYKHQLMIADDEANKIEKLYKENIESDRWECADCDENFFLYDGVEGYICTFCDAEDIAARCNVCYKLFPLSDKYDSIEDGDGDFTYFCSEECLICDQNSKGCGPDQ